MVLMASRKGPQQTKLEKRLIMDHTFNGIYSIVGAKFMETLFCDFYISLLCTS